MTKKKLSSSQLARNRAAARALGVKRREARANRHDTIEQLASYYRHYVRGATKKELIAFISGKTKASPHTVRADLRRLGIAP